MKINLPLVNTSKVKEVMKDNNGMDGLTNIISDNLKRYNLYKIFSIFDFYEMKSALIEAANKTDGVTHIIILDENGYTEWVDYTEDSVRFISISDKVDTLKDEGSNKSFEIVLKNIVNDLYAKWEGIIKEDNIIGDAEGYTKDDLIANLYTILREDFGFDMYIEEYAVNIGHGVRIDKPDNIYDFAYRYVSALYRSQIDMIKNTKDDGRLSTWLGMNAAGLLNENNLIEDIVLIDFDISEVKREYPYEIDMLAYNDRSYDMSDTYIYLLNYILKASHEFVKGIRNETN